MRFVGYLLPGVLALWPIEKWYLDCLLRHSELYAACISEEIFFTTAGQFCNPFLAQIAVGVFLVQLGNLFHQIEITTRCNFSCSYCAGRSMDQQDMDWETFKAIVDGLSPQHQHCTVSLQGEGEPSLHPLFWCMADYVTTSGHTPYSILNGSRLDAARIAATFPRIGISLDTLDASTAERIGRHNLTKVLRNLEELTAVMSPSRITVMSVDMGQPLGPLRAWVRQRGFGRHVIQPLARKDDYARHYGTAIRFTPRRQPESAVRPSSTCRFVQSDLMRFYTWKGQELPCCFIKDTTGIESIPQLKQSLARGEVPPGCSGCSELRPL
ncbi:radical SAM protein [Variovorax sp. RKNM96]|uniref:radical SAM protein n=1 Tax=Variovorax sp. RKNM96 TaxID=2681552 RepID=UPI00240268BB|nr:radical SAM protein [Variovorax sp. RKNM96]